MGINCPPDPEWYSSATSGEDGGAVSLQTLCFSSALTEGGFTPVMICQNKTSVNTSRFSIAAIPSSCFNFKTGRVERKSCEDNCWARLSPRRVSSSELDLPYHKYTSFSAGSTTIYTQRSFKPWDFTDSIVIARNSPEYTRSICMSRGFAEEPLPAKVVGIWVVGVLATVRGRFCGAVVAVLGAIRSDARLVTTMY